MSGDRFHELLVGMLANELRVWERRLCTESIRAFDVGCFPWHGSFELSFLTENEPVLAAVNNKFESIADWRWYNFTQTFESTWPQARHVGSRMRREWEAAADKDAATEAYLKTCALAVSSFQVAAALSKYRLSPDFEVSVFNPDKPEVGNYCRRGEV